MLKPAARHCGRHPLVGAQVDLLRRGRGIERSRGLVAIGWITNDRSARGWSTHLDTSATPSSSQDASNPSGFVTMHPGSIPLWCIACCWIPHTRAIDAIVGTAPLHEHRMLSSMIRLHAYALHAHCRPHCLTTTALRLCGPRARDCRGARFPAQRTPTAHPCK